MIYVIFTKSETKDIKRFEKMSFSEACSLTYKLEKKMHRKNIISNVDFWVLNESELGEDEDLYEGTLRLGSNFALSIYQHIVKTLALIPMDEEQKIQKDELIDMLNMELPEEIQHAEESQDAESQHASAIDDLKPTSRIIRKIVYVVGILSVIFLSVACFILTSNLTNKTAAIAEMKNDIDYEKIRANTYESALLGEKEEALKILSDKEENNLSKEEKVIYTNLLLDEKEYRKAVNLNDKNVDVIEEILLNKGNIEELKDFNTEYPSNNGNFDIAFYENRFKDAVKITGVDINSDREKMIAYSYFKLFNVKEAKRVAHHINNQELNGKITLLETVNKELIDIDKKLIKEDSKDKKEDETIKKLEEAKKQKEGERKKLTEWVFMIN